MCPHVARLTEININSKSVPCYDPSFNVNQGDTHDKTVQYPMNAHGKPLAGIQYSTFSGGFDVAGEGTAIDSPPDIANLYKACGLKETPSGGVSITYAVTGDLPTDTSSTNIESFQGGAGATNGLQQDCASSVGNGVWVFTPGEPLRFNYDGEGVYTAPTEDVTAVAVANSAVAVAVKGLTATIGTDPLVFRSITIDLGNVVTRRPAIEGTLGLQVPVLTDQKPTLTIEAEFPLFSVDDIFASWTGATKKEFSIVVGSVAFNILTITGSFYANASPIVSEGDGILMVTQTYDQGWADDDTKLNFIFT